MRAVRRDSVRPAKREGDPEDATRTPGVVAFAHGSGSGQFSPRNQFVAQVLQDARLATLLAQGAFELLARPLIRGERGCEAPFFVAVALVVALNTITPFGSSVSGLGL